MHWWTFVVASVAAFFTATSYSSNVPELKARQNICGGTDVWSEWGQNCCGESPCSSIPASTTSTAEISSNRTTLHSTVFSTHTTTIPFTGCSILTQTITITSATPSETSSSLSPLPPVPLIISSPTSSDWDQTTSCSNGSIPTGYAPPNLPPAPPAFPVTTPTPSEHCPICPSSSSNTLASGTDMSPTNSGASNLTPDATTAVSAATGETGKPTTTSKTGSMTSSHSSEGPAETSLTSPFTGTSGVVHLSTDLVAAASLVLLYFYFL